jgi:hypothetical protein
MGRPLDSYPQSIGSSVISVFPHTGPASYVQIVVSTGAGDKAQGAEAGLKYFDYVVGGLTDSGTYRVECIPSAASTSPASAPSTTYLLRWIVVSTGAQVAANVNLSAETVRLLAFGPK